MTFSSAAILTALLNGFGVERIPASLSPTWHPTSAWELQGHSVYLFSATSEVISKQCASSPNSVLILPAVVHGYQQLFADGRLVGAYGNPEFSPAFPYYTRPHVPCALLSEAKVVKWTSSSYSTFFARISGPPSIAQSASQSDFFTVTANILATGALLALSLFSFLIFRGRVDNQITYSLSLGALGLSIYFMNTVNSYFAISVDMLASHKVADLALWIGAVLFLNASRVDGWLSAWVFRTFSAAVVAGSSIILLGSSGDDVQMGTMVPAPFFLLCALNVIARLALSASSMGWTANSILRAVSVALFALFGISDLMSVTGITNAYMLMSFGSVLGIFGLALAVNQAIERTYQERDSLLKNLEDKVSEKTSHLQDALAQLKQTQAELVESARLASLGTLSAGIAHEINNSINYINGAVGPLEKRVMAHASEADKPLLAKLFGAIKNGTNVTVEIVRSLRNYTGLNHAKLKDFQLLESVNSILTILKTRTGNIQVRVEVPPTMVVFGSLVGMNQILMNLVSNAVDAVDPQAGKIGVSAVDQGTDIQLSVSDNGSGIPPEVKARIFDPFFTTKEVGKGTGLGLHIVKKEVERAGGKLTVASEVGKGTTFTVLLPKVAAEEGRAA